MWAVLRYKKTIKNKGYGFFLHTSDVRFFI